jgi:hypothetical protein
MSFTKIVKNSTHLLHKSLTFLSTIRTSFIFFERGYAELHLVEALRYKPEGRGFDSRWRLKIFLNLTFRPHYDRVVDTASNRNEHQRFFLRRKDGRCVGLTILPPSRADSLNILETSTFWSPRGLSRPVQGYLYLVFKKTNMCKNPNIAVTSAIGFVRFEDNCVQFVQCSSNWTQYLSQYFQRIPPSR